MNRGWIIFIVLLMLSLAYPSWGYTTDLMAAQKLDNLVDKYKDGIINSTQELIRVKSVPGDPEPGARHGYSQQHL